LPNVAKGFKDASDPYVKLSFGDVQQFQTNVCSKSLNPKWNQTFNFTLLADVDENLVGKQNSKHQQLNAQSFKLQTRELCVSVFDHDNIFDHERVGQMKIEDLDELVFECETNGGTSRSIDVWKRLDNGNAANNAGQIHLVYKLVTVQAFNISVPMRRF